MRVSKKIWVIIGFIVIAIVLGLMASNYFQASAEHRALEERLTLGQTRVPALTAEKEDLENQERQARSMLETSQGKFPEEIESIEYGEDLCRIAVKYGLKVIDFSTSPPADKTLEGLTYSVSSYKIVVGDGTIANILSYLDELRMARDFELPWSADIREVKVDYVKTQATISIDIYGYKG